MTIISGRRIIPVEMPEPPAKPDTATILYNQLLSFCNLIAADNVIFTSQMVPARHVFFRERVIAFGIFLITCCYGNIDLGTEIADRHREKLSQTKSQSQADTYMADVLRTFQTFKIADEKARKKHRFDNTAAMGEMIPYFLSELNADKNADSVFALRERVFDFIDILNSHEI